MSAAVGVINSKVLVLNRNYLPVHVTSVRRAFSLLYQGIARAVDNEYRTFDFQSWSALSVAVREESIGLVGGAIRIPRVILLLTYDRVPKRQIRFNRFNVYARDRNTCQYCGSRLSRPDLTLDHVIPRSQGGHSSWENIVCCCQPCNRRKGGRTPRQAAMKLLRPARRPDWTPFVLDAMSLRGHRDWLPFLSTVDAAYWNNELEP
jgi:5-methylcytosine-specific restriction endonuclease McrA